MISQYTNYLYEFLWATEKKFHKLSREVLLKCCIRVSFKTFKYYWGFVSFKEERKKGQYQNKYTKWKKVKVFAATG